MLRKLLIALAIVVVVLIAGAGYIWQRGTALPEWYEQERAQLEALEASEDGDELELDAPLTWTVIPEAQAPLDADNADAHAPSIAPAKARRELRNFHLRSGASSKAAREAFRASRAVYEDGHLEAGVVVNASKPRREELTRKERDFFKRISKAFPPLAGRDVYVALEDEPVVGPDGILQLGPNPKVKVGELSYSLSALAKKLGVNPSALRRDINREFKRLKVTDPAHLPSLAD